MFWFNKHHPGVIFSDVRVRPKGFMPERPNFNVEPNEVNDFRQLRYPDKTFELVVFDPPHLIRPVAEQGIITKKYGSLEKNSWREDLEKGFKECWRVLSDDGILIFKWNEREKKLKERDCSTISSAATLRPSIGLEISNALALLYETRGKLKACERRPARFTSRRKFL